MVDRRNLLLLRDLFLTIVFLFIIFFPWASYVKSGISLSNMLSGPTSDHFLGTDNLGRDLLLRVTNALWQAVIPMWATVLLGTGLGLSLGIGSIAWCERQPNCRPLVESAKVVGALLGSIPVGVVAFAWAAYEEKAGLFPVAATLFAMFIVRSFLQVHNLFLESERLGFWEAHRSIGGSLVDRLVRYGLWSQWQGPIIDSLCFQLRVAVTIEASLSYLGFGIQEPNASFGNILASHFDLALKGQWYTMLVVSVALLLSAQFPASLFSVVRAIATMWRGQVAQHSPKEFVSGSMDRCHPEVLNPPL
jgi:peptide/nickel transport system permease protein